MTARLPPLSARFAIGLGFLIGTWALVEGLDDMVTGRSMELAGHALPWAAWGVAAVLLGALWMLIGNLYLYQHRPANWLAMIALLVVSAWFAGWGVWILLAQLVLLLLPATRQALAPSPQPENTL